MGVVLLVRHGQASFGADDYDVLSPTGWEQGRLLGRYLAARDVVPTAVVRGGLRRHRETAEAVLDGGGWAAGDLPVTEDVGWDEFDHLAVVAAHPEFAAAGEDALDRRRFQALFEVATARWAAGEHDDDYPESYAGFRQRVREALERSAERAGPGGVVLVVTSGGPVAAAGAALLGAGADPGVWSRLNTVVVNTSVTRVVVGASGARLLTFNEHAHLEGDTLTYR